MFSSKKKLKKELLELKSDKRRIAAENNDIRDRLFKHWELIYKRDQETSKLKRKISRQERKISLLIKENRRLLSALNDIHQQLTEPKRRHKRKSSRIGSEELSNLVDKSPRVHYLNQEKIIHVKQSIPDNSKVKVVTPRNIQIPVEFVEDDSE